MEDHGESSMDVEEMELELPHVDGLEKDLPTTLEFEITAPSESDSFPDCGLACARDSVEEIKTPEKLKKPLSF